jgi:hypothetical protein
MQSIGGGAGLKSLLDLEQQRGLVLPELAGFRALPPLCALGSFLLEAFGELRQASPHEVLPLPGGKQALTRAPIAVSEVWAWCQLRGLTSAEQGAFILSGVQAIERALLGDQPAEPPSESQ